MKRQFTEEGTQIANKHVKGGSAFQLIRKMQIKTKISFYFTLSDS